MSYREGGYSRVTHKIEFRKVCLCPNIKGFERKSQGREVCLTPIVGILPYLNLGRISHKIFVSCIRMSMSYILCQQIGRIY